MIKLRAHDGHELDAYLAQPAARPRGAVVIAQEMYGVNAYLGAVCDFYAGHGYLAIAPSLYDRRQRGMTFAYERPGTIRRSAPTKPGSGPRRWPISMPGRAMVAQAGKVGLIGFCWGGSLAWVGACRSAMTPPSPITARRCRTCRRSATLPSHRAYRRPRYDLAASADRTIPRGATFSAGLYPSRRQQASTTTGPSVTTQKPASWRAN